MQSPFVLLSCSLVLATVEEVALHLHGPLEALSHLLGVAQLHDPLVWNLKTTMPSTSAVD